MIHIEFQRNGDKNCTTAWVRIWTDLAVEKQVIWFGKECNNQVAAELLVRHLTAELRKQIESAHQNGYEQGWRDAKAKRTKATVFDGFFRKHGDSVT